MSGRDLLSAEFYPGQSPHLPNFVQRPVLDPGVMGLRCTTSTFRKPPSTEVDGTIFVPRDQRTDDPRVGCGTALLLVQAYWAG